MNTDREHSTTRVRDPRTGTVALSTPGRLRRWTALHPVAAFLVTVFFIGYPVMALPILASHGVISDGWMPLVAGVDTERVASVLLVFVALVPAALWVTWADDGRTGVHQLIRRMFRWRIGVTWTVLVLAGIPALTLTFALLIGDTLKSVDVVALITGQVFGLLVNLALINMWEEAAWSGVVQTRLEHRHGLVKAALLTAVPFALVHMPLHFIGSFTLGSLIAALITLLIVCALVRLLIGVFLRGTRHSILAVAVLHSVFNRSNNDEGLIAALVEGNGRKLAGLIAVVVLTAALALVTRRRQRRGYTQTDHDVGTGSSIAHHNHEKASV